MPAQGRAPFREITFANGVQIFTGPRATRALIAGDHPNAPIGSLYLQNVGTGGTGRMYSKATHTGKAD